eukprot:1186641-Prorocentrum_minimum.AAC.7
MVQGAPLKNVHCSGAQHVMVGYSAIRKLTHLQVFRHGLLHEVEGCEVNGDVWRNTREGRQEALVE